jgi:hypothetical protein
MSKLLSANGSFIASACNHWLTDVGRGDRSLSWQVPSQLLSNDAGTRRDFQDAKRAQVAGTVGQYLCVGREIHRHEVAVIKFRERPLKCVGYVRCHDILPDLF